MNKHQYKDSKSTHFRDLKPGDRFMFEGLTWEKYEGSQPGAHHTDQDNNSLCLSPGNYGKTEYLPGATLIKKI